jgi:YHS domain-containing protein
MVRMNVMGRILVGAVVCGSLVAGIAFGNPVQSSDSGKVSVTAKTATPARQLKPQTTCPVMGNEINKSLYVDYNGKRIYVCCTMCLDSVKKDPAKYIKKLEKMGQSVETIAEAKGDSAKVAAKDSSAIPKKCSMAGDTSKKMCAMAGDTSKVKGCYTCPLHPEVMQKTPGKCPKCGMDLVFKKCEMGKNGECKMKKQN